MWCLADDNFGLAALRLRPFYESGFGAALPVNLLLRAIQDPKFILKVVAFSTSVAAGGRTCPESLNGKSSCCTVLPPGQRLDRTRLGGSAAMADALENRMRSYGNGSVGWHSQYTSGWFDCGCGWPGRLARLLSLLLPRGKFLVHNMNRHATGPVYPLELLESDTFLKQQGREAHVFVLDYAVRATHVPRALCVAKGAVT